MSSKQMPIDEVARCRRTLLASDQEFRADWLADGDRTVVPIEEFNSFSDDPAGERIVSAHRAAGDARLLCLTTADLGPDEPSQAAVVTLDPVELDAWWEEVRPFDVVLASPDLVRATLVSVDEFALVAGPVAFVEHAVGMSVVEARKAFAVYADDMKSASRHLPALAEKYGCR